MQFPGSSVGWQAPVPKGFVVHEISRSHTHRRHLAGNAGKTHSPWLAAGAVQSEYAMSFLYLKITAFGLGAPGLKQPSPPHSQPKSEIQVRVPSLLIFCAQTCDPR